MVHGVSVRPQKSPLAVLVFGRFEWIQNGIELVLPEIYLSLLVACAWWEA
jgi:hypothetical protein